MPAPPTVVESPPISDVFQQLATDLQKVVTATNAPVDLKLTFTAVTISSRGVPLFSRKKEETSMEITLATRITP
ncbi:MAG TPA: hypothetical protein VF092_04530 [Longimicrobium sp.]